ncbi:MAG: DUF1513 domain-containing protein [Paracoccaceae bacterium]
MASRRAFLAGLLAASLPRPSWADLGNPAFLAAGKRGSVHELHGLSSSGDSLFALPLPARGHAAAAHPLRAEAVAFARRPGTFARVVNCLTGTPLAELTPPVGRQFNGHGAYSADGQWLMTSEVVAEGSAGRIGLWDTARYIRVGEWDSGGIGPHDIKLLADGRIVVANGGIQTDPTDRSKLNLDRMQPNLALLSPNGALLDRVEMPADLRQNSIRHLALTARGVAFAMQWEGDPALPVPQLGLWTPGEAPVFCPPDDADSLAMKGYAGSIATGAGLTALTSAPGGALMLFDAAGAPLATLRRADISGVAAGPAGLVASDGQGGLWSVAPDGLQLLARHPVLWDNHLVALPL